MPFPFLPFLASAGSALLGKVSGGLVDKATGAIVDKVAGVPTPAQPKSGRERGMDDADYMDAVYPGTTPWERLGAPSAGGAGVASAEASGKIQKDLQSRELDNRREIADMNNRATIISSLGSVSPMASKSGLDQLLYGPGGPYVTKTGLESKLLSFQQRELAARTKGEEGLAKERGLRGDISEGIKAVGWPVAEAAKFAGSKYADFENWLLNRGSKPRRFGSSKKNMQVMAGGYA